MHLAIETTIPRTMLFLIVALAVLGPASSAVADTYEFHIIADDLESPFPGDINNWRQVVGYSNTPSGEFEGFVWSRGHTRPFVAPGADSTFGNGINDWGILAGHAIFGPVDGPHENRGFVKIGRWFITIAFPFFNSWSFDINNRGSVVGLYCEDGSVPGCLNEPFPPPDEPPFEIIHAYLLNRYGYSMIDPPGALAATAFGNNDRGDIVGTFEDEAGFHGYKRNKRGDYTSFDGPDAVYTEARGINNRRDIVGFYVAPPDFLEHGFVRNRNGDIVTVDVPGAFVTIVTAINDRGDLCGIFLTEDFEQKAFIALKRRGRW